MRHQQRALPQLIAPRQRGRRPRHGRQAMEEGGAHARVAVAVDDVQQVQHDGAVHVRVKHLDKTNQKRLLAINNLKHSTILNSIVTIHDINTIYQVICTIIEGNANLRHPTYRKEAATSRNYLHLRNNRFDTKHIEKQSRKTASSKQTTDRTKHGLGRTSSA